MEVMKKTWTQRINRKARDCLSLDKDGQEILKDFETSLINNFITSSSFENIVQSNLNQRGRRKQLMVMMLENTFRSLLLQRHQMDSLSNYLSWFFCSHSARYSSAHSCITIFLRLIVSQKWSCWGSSKSRTLSSSWQICDLSSKCVDTWTERWGNKQTSEDNQGESNCL